MATTVLSVANCLDLALMSWHQLITIYPVLKYRLSVRESMSGYGYVLMFDGSPEEFTQITTRPIKYDLSHLA